MGTEQGAVMVFLKLILRSMFFADDAFVDDYLQIEQTQGALQENSVRRPIRVDAADERHHCRWHLRMSDEARSARGRDSRHIVKEVIVGLCLCATRGGLTLGPFWISY